MRNKELEKKLWASAEALRGNISSEEYMYIVIGIMFLKHMSDKYNNAVKKLKSKKGDSYEKYLNDGDIISKYGSQFIVPNISNWDHISKYTKDARIGEVLDVAFEKIEDANKELIGIFDKRYNREEIDQTKLGQVVSEFSNIDLSKMGEDVIGRTYEFFLGQFFIKQGQKGGEFYTPKTIVDLMVRIINPSSGKVYDPTAGTGGMLVQARQHLIEMGENPMELVAYGQEYQNKTWKLSRINLLLHGFPSSNINLGDRSGDTLLDDLHQHEKFNYVLANPPFNVKKWAYEETKGDPRWEWGRPPKNNANLAFISHMIHKLLPNGRGASVLANGELSASGKQQVEIRKNMIQSGVIEAIVSLPDKLFYTTGIPASIWFFSKNKTNKKILMIDASNIEGRMISKKVRELKNEDINLICETFKKFQKGEEVNEVGFAKSISIDDLEENDYSFVPGRYVGYKEEKIDKELLQKEIDQAYIEIKKLSSELTELLPQVLESIKKAKDI